MASIAKRGRWAWLVMGILVGLVVGGLLPDVPVHAVATDKAENITVATGFVEEGIEAFYFLDSLTGTLQAVVPSNQTKTFQARWTANLNADLRAVVATAGKRTGVRLPEAPKYLMVTGMLDLKRGAARAAPGRAVIYITEVNTGVVLCYVVPWSMSQHSANQPFGGQLGLWVADSFATAITRDAE
jgi:hypothetical protein